MTKARRGRFFEYEDLIIHILGDEWELVLQSTPDRKEWIKKCEDAAEVYLPEHKLPLNPVASRKKEEKTEKGGK